MQRETRIKKELKILGSDPPPGISCWMVDDRIDHLHGNIIGSEDTPYCDGIFKLDLNIPERYPFQPPKVQFLTPIYHPNIDNAGRICLDILKMPPKGGWKPSWNVSTVLKSIQSLMAEPNPEDPLMAEISEQYKYQRHEFNKTAEQWTKKHAISNVAKPTTECQDQFKSEMKDPGCSSWSTLREIPLVDRTNNERNAPLSKCPSKRLAENDESVRPLKITKYK
ncbi:ubiquitin-conjugating enzyme E2 T-like [Dendronephthya gigantea]|uniref:ubiquitin-conjugating enzyme E2 T-like n=1 Tax=Dendronephthya gigantea TaxID=151771 RepID=UPI00106AD10F|nr:ubiquitin-conjugating enzyme E2 T-like [Dendronephthya gigantea]